MKRLRDETGGVRAGEEIEDDVALVREQFDEKI
jgi:hypothetical protein